jgi:hypothetical protein
MMRSEKCWGTISTMIQKMTEGSDGKVLLDINDDLC